MNKAVRWNSRFKDVSNKAELVFGEIHKKGGRVVSYQKPEMKKIKTDIAPKQMAADKGECHGGHCVRCIQAYG